jgi:DinB family protein
MTPAQREQRIELYANGPLRLRSALARVPDAAVKWRPGPGRWSAHEIVCHCADSELNAAARLRYLVAEKDPVVLGYDQDNWARLFDYHTHPLEPALATVESVRANTVPVLRRLTGEQWSREGRHTQSGRYTVLDWLRIYSDHVENHSRQIERNVEAWVERGAG